MKSLLNRISFVIIFLACILYGGCSNQVDETEKKVEAEVPKLTFLSPDITVSINQSVTLKVEASVKDEGILSYQWYYGIDKLSGGTLIEGNGVQKDFCPDVSKSGLTLYYCVITNTLGSSKKSIVSPWISVTVAEKIDAKLPVIDEQPLNVTVQIAEKFELSTYAHSVDNGILSYQWYFSTTENGDFLAIEGAVDRKFSGQMTLKDVGYYYCMITNTIINNYDGGMKNITVATSKILLADSKISANLPVITAQPVSVKAVIPAERTFTVGAYSPDDGTLSYQWFSIVNSEDASGVLIDGATDNNYTTPNSLTEGKTGYYCVITNKLPDNGDGGTKTAAITSETAWFETFYLKNAVSVPVFIKQPTSMSIAPYNQGVTLSCEANLEGFDISYQWYETIDGTTESGVPLTSGEGADSYELIYTFPFFDLCS